LSRGTSTRFTFDPSISTYAIWSPDGKQIIFASNRGGTYNLYLKPTSGAKDEELLLKSSEDKYPDSWSRDGRFLMYDAKNPKTKYDLWVLPLDGDKKPFPFLRTEFNEEDGQFSPDGHWVAYRSDESGHNEIYVRGFSPDSADPSAGGKWLISNSGGSDLRWGWDGKELYYIAPDGKLTVAEVTTKPVFQAGAPKALFQVPRRVTTLIEHWDFTSDGKRFLFPAPAAQTAPAPFTVVLNWQAGLKK
jgi:Tol biopolymer transport system component